MSVFLIPAEMHQLHPDNTMGIRVKPKGTRLQPESISLQPKSISLKPRIISLKPKMFRIHKTQKKKPNKCIPATEFPFFDLPPELRIQIYEWAILQRQTNGAVKKRNTLEHLPGHGHGPLAEAAITRVSTLTRMESLPIFYKLRRFPLLSQPLQTKNPSYHKDEEPKLSSWMNQIHPAKFTMMKSFAVELRVPHHYDKDDLYQFFMSIDIKGRGHDIWFGKAWNGGAYRPLEKYWSRVVTRKGSGVPEIMTRLQAILAKLDYGLTREDILLLAQATTGE